MRAIGSMAVAAFALGALSACSKSPAVAPAASKAGAGFVKANPALTDPKPFHWQSARVVGKRAIVVSFVGGDSACWGLAKADGRQDGGSVVVTLYQGTPARAPDSCSDIGLMGETRLEFDTDIAGKTIIDGAP
jgi:hypothetical protein